MTSSRTARRALFGTIGALALLAPACSDDDESTTTEAPTTEAADTSVADTTAPEGTDAPATTEVVVMFEGDLVGTFELTAGDCAGGTATGSWFQMVNPGGTAADGPFVPNGDSGCTADPNYSLLTPGTDGGLTTGGAQVAPEPAFDDTGNGLAGAIFVPVKFFGVDFAGAMDATGAAPTASAADGVLTADLTAFTAYYGGGMFNQGAMATGTIDPMTGEFMLEWTSLISGGSFDGFTGVWHLEGTFTSAG